MHQTNNDRAMLLILLSITILGIDCRLTISPETASWPAGSQTVVVCKDSDGAKVTWRGPKGVLNEQTRPRVRYGPQGDYIHFEKIEKTDAGNYTCSIDNESKRFQLVVYEPLKFMDVQTLVEVSEGKDAVLRCDVNEGVVTWPIVETNPNKYKVLGDGMLIKKVRPSDAGIYTCKAFQQSSGTLLDHNITLRVLHKPYFLQENASAQEVVWGFINGTVNLKCAIMAVPAPTFQWYKNQNNTNKIGRQLNVNANVSVLQMILDKNNFGNYKCTAENKYGKLEKLFIVKQGEKSPIPDHFSLKENGDSWLLLDIRPNLITNPKPHTKPIGFSVAYRNSDEFNWNMQHFNITDDHNYILTDLHPETKYQMRAATRNLAGLSDYTKIVEYTTTSSVDSIILSKLQLIIPLINLIHLIW